MVDEPKARPLDRDATTRLTDFARACKAAARAVSLYPAGHPTVGTTVGRLVEAAGRATAAGGFTLMVLPDNLLVDGSPAERSDPAVGELAALLHRHFVGGLSLHGAADAEAWQTLMRLLGRPPEEVRAEGGIKQLWTEVGAPSIEIQEIDYAQILREGGAEAASLEEIMSRLLTGEGEWDASTIAALVDVVGDPAKLEELWTKLQERVTEGDASAQATAVFRMLKAAVTGVLPSGPEQAEAAFKNMAKVTGQLAPEVLLKLLEQRGSTEAMAGEVNAIDAVTQHMEESAVTRFVAQSMIADGGASERLAEAFQALVPVPDRKRQVLAQVEQEVSNSPLGEDTSFPALWEQAEQMLTSYSDEPFVPQAYARELSRARGQAVEVERTGEDPPERIAAWLATVDDSVLKGLDLQLLLDLLSIESDPLRWRDIVDTVCSQVDAFVQAGDVETARRVVEAVAHEAEGAGRSHQPHAQTALERLASGSMMRHALRHLRSATDEGADDVKRLCTALGPLVVSPLAEVLSAESDARARRRLRDILLSFGASGRAAVQQLLHAPNWEVRQTAAFLLREFAGAEGMPGLDALLNDAEPLVQREAIRALLLIGDERNYDVLVKVLSANASRCRETLIQQLGSQRDERAIPLCGHLIRRLDHKTVTDVYLAVIAALGTLGGPDAVKALREALYRGEWWAPSRTKALRSAAAEALRKTKMPVAQQALREASTNGPRGVRRAARNQLALMEQA